jgi:pSer/pThr/pTyr-binding forkhead associated (FHA) protein
MVITFTLHNGEKLKFTTDKTSLVIGRSPSCDIVIPSESVSRKHCRIDFKDGNTYVTDLGGINGIFMDGEKIPVSKPVFYNEYMNLAFGEVSGMELEYEASIEPSNSHPKARVSTQSMKEKTEAKKKTPLSTPKDKANEKLLNIISVLLLILAAVYYFYQTE